MHQKGGDLNRVRQVAKRLMGHYINLKWCFLLFARELQTESQKGLRITCGSERFGVLRRKRLTTIWRTSEMRGFKLGV